MIKFFQKLKAKKGFTLVELIVVIAIIGVLAAILVPTMLGYVTSSRVTSANSTASSLKNNIDTFLTNADTAGYGMKLSSGAQCTLTMTIDADGEWTVAVGAGTAFGEGEGDGATGSGTDAFKTGGSLQWEDEGTTTADMTKAEATDATTLLALELKGLFPEVKSSCARAYIQGGKSMYLWYTADDADGEDVGTTPGVEDFEAETFAWDGNTAGVNDEGLIMGTAPALTLGTASADDAGDGE